MLSPEDDSLSFRGILCFSEATHPMKSQSIWPPFSHLYLSARMPHRKLLKGKVVPGTELFPQQRKKQGAGWNLGHNDSNKTLSCQS